MTKKFAYMHSEIENGNVDKYHFNLYTRKFTYELAGMCSDELNIWN
jgi:hypothetical protein